MDLHTVRYEVTEGVGTVTLDRPDRLNAWTGRMHTEYRWALAQAEDDPAVRVVVVTGAGRGFCGGADARALEKHAERGGYDDGVREPLAEPGYGVRPAKRQLYTDLHRDVGTAVAESEALLDRMMGEPDYTEGVQAYLQRRPSHFADPVTSRATTPSRPPAAPGD